MNTSICTWSGLEFDFNAPKPSMVRICDIAMALSRMPRYAGHTNKFYSVAEHSVRVAMELNKRKHPPEAVMMGLLHDAGEAYLMDIPSPLKGLLPDYQRIEDKVQATINEKYGLSNRFHGIVKEADLFMMGVEKRDLMPLAEWWDTPEPDFFDHDEIIPWTQEEALNQFHTMFGRLLFPCGMPYDTR